jgi:hypothetical protein
MRVGGLSHQKWRARVGGKHPVPLLGGDVFECGLLEEAGVVDQNVELAELFDYRGDGLADALGVGEVGADGECIDVKRGERADGLFGFGLRFAIGDGDVGAGGRKLERDGAANGVDASRSSLLSGSGIAGL